MVEQPRILELFSSLAEITVPAKLFPCPKNICSNKGRRQKKKKKTYFGGSWRLSMQPARSTNTVGEAFFCLSQQWLSRDSSEDPIHNFTIKSVRISVIATFPLATSTALVNHQVTSKQHACYTHLQSKYAEATWYRCWAVCLFIRKTETRLNKAVLSGKAWVRKLTVWNAWYEL